MQRAMALNPDRADLRVALGNAHLSLGQLDAAEQAYQAAIASIPTWLKPTMAWVG
jgi:tetratricopeptide (TPR) repeat protein